MMFNKCCVCGSSCEAGNVPQEKMRLTIINHYGTLEESIAAKSSQIGRNTRIGHYGNEEMVDSCINDPKEKGTIGHYGNSIVKNHWERHICLQCEEPCDRDKSKPRSQDAGA